MSKCKNNLFNRRPEHTTRDDVVAVINRDNVRYATVAAALPTIAEILDSYAGKRCGQKTRERLVNEVLDKTGLWLRLHADCIELYRNDWDFFNDWVRVVDKHGFPILENHRIEPIFNAEDLIIAELEPIRDPIQRAREVVELMTRRQNLKRELCEIEKRYNEIKPDGMFKII